MLKKIVTIGLLTILLSPNLLAHGMNAPGPNGGNITMPANYHVELLEDKKASVLKVYLLDVAFKNPVTVDSTVSVSINSQAPLECKVEKEYFICPTKALKAGDKISVASTRSKIKGGTATYSYPLKY